MCRFHVAVRAPSHLGDGVMALPALQAIRAVSARMTIYAPRWGPALYRELDALVLPTGAMGPADAAVLMAPSLRAAWEARAVPRRIGTAADRRGPLLTEVVEEGVHQADTYARLAAAVGGRAEGPPRYRSEVVDTDIPAGHVGLNPISVSGAVREWPGYSALADRLARPVVFYGGPGDQEAVARIAGNHEARVGLSLPDFAAALSRCALFVSNDSGAAHFAAACGVPVLVVYGSTTASRTGPAGAVGVEGPPLPCRPCYKQRCALGRPACLDIPVGDVLSAVERALG
ncbi:MAG: glycosyltransferase family 9 protein [Deltaproteobacteria bacterium]|nr:glycosyltransferase family 9 protein [Deltaproteobacteria bacterium]